MEILDRFGVKSPTTRSLPTPLCPIASRFPSPLGGGRRVQQFDDLSNWNTSNVFPSPLGAKSPTILKGTSQSLYYALREFPSPLGAKSPTMWNDWYWLAAKPGFRPLSGQRVQQFEAVNQLTGELENRVSVPSRGKESNNRTRR